MKHQCHPLSAIFLCCHDGSKYKTEIFTSALQKFGCILPLCVTWPPFHKDFDNLLDPAVFLLSIKPSPIVTSHETTFIQLNDLHYLVNHMPASPNGFSYFPLASLTIYFEGGCEEGCNGPVLWLAATATSTFFIVSWINDAATGHNVVRFGAGGGWGCRMVLGVW